MNGTKSLINCHGPQNSLWLISGSPYLQINNIILHNNELSFVYIFVTWKLNIEHDKLFYFSFLYNHKMTIKNNKVIQVISKEIVTWKQFKQPSREKNEINTIQTEK